MAGNKITLRERFELGLLPPTVESLSYTFGGTIRVYWKDGSGAEFHPDTLMDSDGKIVYNGVSE